MRDEILEQSERTIARADVARSRDEWLAARAGGIGGSEVGAIMDFYFPGNVRLDSRKTALDVYLAKIGQAAPIEETEEMF